MLASCCCALAAVGFPVAAAPFVSGSGAGLGATDEEAVDAEGGRDTRLVGDLARAGASEIIIYFCMCQQEYYILTNSIP